MGERNEIECESRDKFDTIDNNTATMTRTIYIIDCTQLSLIF
jgi:hypothetical protein